MLNNNEMMIKDVALKGKIAWVTGGGTGLGKSMTEGFLRAGAKVVISSRKIEVLEQTAEELRQINGAEVLPIACDVRKYEEIEALLAQVKNQWGKVPDILLNNAAGNFISPTERLSHKAFDIIVDIVLKGTYNCTLAIGKEWISASTPGVLLSIATTYADTGSGYVVPSACAKAGVVALTKSLASEWAKYGIRSNAIAPGPFPTEGAWSRLFPQALIDKIDPLKRIPLKRYGKHEELANLAVYLVSDYAAYITGQVITIDGGETHYNGGEFNHLDVIPNAMWEAIEKQIRGK
jgi:NAD(P)-dependent dehydrogenase (short-subunit alcohol dehydrogenase family)